MVSSQSFPHLRISIRHTADAPYFVNGPANWWILSIHCTSISSIFIIYRTLAISTLSLRSCITFEPFKCSSSDLSFVLQNTLGTVFNPKISFVIKATKWPASADCARAIVSDLIGLSATLFNFFDFYVIGTALLLPHRNTIWAPWDAPLGKLALVASLYTITFRYSGFPRSG